MEAGAEAVVPSLWRLELAQRTGLPLATLDEALAAAAARAGVATLGADRG